MPTPRAADATPATPAMNPNEERALHDRDPAAWITYAAPRIAAKVHATIAPVKLARDWSLMGRDLQRAVWDQLDPATRQRVRAARAGDAATDILSHRMEQGA